MHFSRLITALVEREHDERSLAGSNQRLRWHEQRGLRTATERYRREHAWLQATAAVGQFDPHGQRPAVGLDIGEDRRHSSRASLAGKGGPRCLYWLTGFALAPQDGRGSGRGEVGASG